MPSHDAPLTGREAELLRPIWPPHLRVDVELRDDAWIPVLDRAIEEARAVGAALGLGLFTNENDSQALRRHAEHLLAVALPVARVLVYPASEGFSAMKTLTPASLVRLVRDCLEPLTGPIVFVGGTNQSFADINRDRPTDPVLPGICFSISPTVHAAEDWSIVENLVGQAEVVEMARSFSADRAICVSPVTIATRFGPYPAGSASPGDLPPPVDVRQGSLLGAGWTAGSVKYLAESGAASVTYFETTGWRGIIETDAGPPMP